MAEVLSTPQLPDSGFAERIATSNPRQELYDRINAFLDSKNGFDEKIKEAFAILLLKPEDEGFGLVEEWLLRWVIVKFRTRRITIGSPVTHPEAWRLIVATIQRIPSHVAARVLNDKKLVNAVQNTLSWLKNTIASPINTSALVSAGIATFNTSQPSRWDFWPCLLYERINDSIGLIVGNALDLQDTSEEDLWISLVECSPKTSAEILGCSLEIICNQFEIFKARFNHSNPADASSLLGPVFHICRRSDEIFDNAARAPKTELYFDYALIPSLRILQKCRLDSESSSAFCDSVFKSLKCGVISRLIKPLREAIHQKGNSSNAERPKKEKYIQKLLSPLKSLLAYTVRTVPQEQSSHRDLDLAGLLFDLAIESSPLDAPRMWSEKAWLRILFSKLVRFLGLLPDAGSDVDVSTSALRTLKHMIKAATPHKILECGILEQVLHHYSKIYDGPDGSIDWQLITLCLEANPTLVVGLATPNVNAGVWDNQHQGNALGALLLFTQDLKLSDLRCWSSNAVIPIVKAFLAASNAGALLDLWQAQLTLTTNDSSAVSLDPFNRTVWENEDILRLIAVKMGTCLTNSQFTDSVSDLLRVLSQYLASNGGPISGIQYQLRSTLILLDCFISALNTEKALALATRGSDQLTVNICSDLLTRSPSIPDLPTWRIWRILANMTHCIYKVPGRLEAIQVSSVFEELRIRMANDPMLAFTTQAEYTEPIQEKLEIFKYLASWIATEGKLDRACADGENPLPFLKSLESSVMCSERNGGLVKHIFRYFKEGPRDEPSAFAPLELDCVSYLTIIDLDMKTRDFLFNYLLAIRTVAMMSNVSKTRDGLSHRDLWVKIMSSITLGDDKELQGYLISALARAIKNDLEYPIGMEIGVENEIRNRDLVFTFDDLLKIPQPVFKASDKRQIINAVLSAFASPGLKFNEDESEPRVSRPWSMQGNTFSRALKLLLHVTGGPAADTQLNSNLGIFLKHAALFSSRSIPCQRDEDLRNFIEMIRRILAYILFEIAESSNNKPFIELANIVESKAQPGDAKAEIYSTELWSLMTLSFIEDHAHLIEAFYSELSRKLDTAIQVSSEQLIKMFDRHSLIPVRSLPLFLEVLTNLSNTALARFEAPHIHALLARFCSTRMPLLTEKTAGDTDTEIFVWCGKLDLKLHEVNGTDPTSGSPWDEYGHDRFAKMPADQQVQILFTLSQVPSSRLREQDLLRFKLGLQHLRDLSSDDSVELRAPLKDSFFVLCHEATATASPKCSMIIMQSLDYMLCKKRYIISQKQVESAVAMITTMAGPGARSYAADRTCDLYTGLCQLLLTLLRSYRAHLRSHLHTIAECVRCLLRCLYTPYLKQDESIVLPRWVDRKGSRATPEEARLLAKILTTLCEPSAAAVSHSRDGLNDATKVARDLAGQHLASVVEEFCASQLGGTVPADAREMLMPGVWAVISAMDITHMRAMNEGSAGADMRAVWKEVYGEWEKAKK